MSGTGSEDSVISLPKGGAAIKGIGERFQPTLFTGTGSHTIPIAVSPGRNGFGPTLSLQYSAGNGNGPFGLGWQLSIPRITRKTEKGLPRYDDADGFVMSGAEDLVRWRAAAPIVRGSFTIYRYRPRTEGLFARIDQWVDSGTQAIHWRATTKDNITSIYGATPAARLADPDHEEHVYEWLLEETFDPFGNYILYEYARDQPLLYRSDRPDLRLQEIFEINRRATQLYIRRIYYGNLPDPLLDVEGHAVTYSDGTPVGVLRAGRRYAFEVVFDYGDWALPTTSPHPSPLPDGEQELFGPDPATSSDPSAVPLRPDRFSSFRAGFEIRTLRSCRRVLMFHHFAELGGPTLVRSTDFEYRTDPDTGLSLLAGVTVTGYEKQADGTYLSASMPPVSFGYTEFRPHEQRYQSIDARSDDGPPLGLSKPGVAVVDLFGTGLPDIVQSGPAGFRYWRNLGGGTLDSPRSLSQIPAGVALGQPGVALGDVDGDGRTDLLVHAGPVPGYFESTAVGSWQTFKPYEIFPSFSLDDPNLRLVDLTGDGRSDALMTEAEEFLWFECLGEQGFAPPQFIQRIHDLNEFPDVFFDVADRRVRLADMSGDGLSDIVLLTNGRIDYWPSVGYGRFGRRVTMENAPRLGDDFDPRRLFLSDLNGTGCADLVYVDVDRVYCWFNRSGNGWSERQTILGTPIAASADSVQFADVFGTGTATLVWSEDFAGQPEGNYRALDLCGGIKPYVLTDMSNNMGATTRVSYAPSTRYFLEDQANGTPWVTSLPFPVQVVDKVEVIDHISKTKLVTTYKYHHGYFDGREREFRGFGRVDQFDTETFDDFTRSSLHGRDAAFTNNVFAYHVPPVETRSWFHTGIYFDESSGAEAADVFDYRELTDRFRQEYYAGDQHAVPLAEHDVAWSETPHEAYRALRGALLRTEVYGRDGSAAAEHPYQVSEHRYAVTELQPRDGNAHGVYLSHPLESLTVHYERNPDDPRIAHTLTLEVDAFGNPLKSLAIAYGRRQPDPNLTAQQDRDTQARTLVTYAEHAYTNGIDDPVLDPANYRTPLPSETRTYELMAFSPADGRRFTVEEWQANTFARLTAAAEIAYEESADASQPQRRLIEHVRTRYRADDLSDLLPLGTVGTLGLPGETCTRALTPGLIARVFGNRVTDAMLADEGKYLHNEGDADWWVPSGRVYYSPAVATPAEELAFATRHFFVSPRSRDPFGSDTLVRYDAYDLCPVETTDAAGNHLAAEYDYRLLQPFRVTDPNGNRSEVAFDTLGLVCGTALMGKSGAEEGDSFAGFTANVSPSQRQAFQTNPVGSAALLLGEASSRIVYDLDRYRSAGEPAYMAILTRETHASDPAPADGTHVHIGVTYADGFGRAIQKKVLQTEPGPLVEGGPVVSPRWATTGWTIFNNKANPVRRYEPFFDDTAAFRFANQIGVSATLFYDPLERVVGTLYPNHTWEKVVLAPWRDERWDVNDTVLVDDPRTDADAGPFFERLPGTEFLPTWSAQRAGGDLGPAEQNAAEKTRVHAATPLATFFDPLGRAFVTVAHNRYLRDGSPIDEQYVTRQVLDIDGNLRALVDSMDRIALRCDSDMLGRRLHEASMEAGERWTLNDVTGQPLYAWNSRDHRFHTRYDSLRRPTDTLLSIGGGPERCLERIVYGESQTNPEQRNQRGHSVQHFDQAGLLITEDFDFKGNLLRSTRAVADEYKKTYDWNHDAVQPSWESFVTSTTYDALNRPVSITAPEGSVYLQRFDEADRLTSVGIQFGGTSAATPFVDRIEYDASGRRTAIDYSNGVRAGYRYDSLTFRLAHLETLRSSDHAHLQDLSYTYDPAGNITNIQDAAQQTIYFANQVVPAANAYEYDAQYRLIQTDGREHIGQASQPETTWNDEFRIRLHHPHDGQAMRRYTERYEYDAAGNFERIVHQATNGNWTREYSYNAPSLLEPGKHGNRLGGTTVGAHPAEAYGYDAQGNMTTLPHLTMMQWDVRDQLQAISAQAVNDGGSETTWYAYSATGDRVRKLTERSNGLRKNERIYVGGFEVYREYAADGGDITLERETLHLMDGNHRLALVDRRTRGTEADVPAQLVRYQISNHAESATLELGDHAQIISYEEYYAYGGTSYQAGAVVSEVALKRYRFVGKERDQESGLAYHGARYYAPWLGRWISCDPSGPTGGINLYVYALSSPVVLVDLDGHKPLKFPVNDDAQKIMWRGRPLGPTQTLPPPGPGHHHRKSGGGAKKRSPSAGPGRPGGMVGGTGSPSSTATKYATSKYVEEGAGNGQGGLGDPGDVGQGKDAGQGGEDGGLPGGSGSKNNPGAPGTTGTPGGKAGGQGKPGGKQNPPKGGTPGSGDGNGNPSTILDDLAALASFLEDPESLYNAKHSGNKGKGAQIGSHFGIIHGLLAQVLVIGMAVFDYAGNLIKKGVKKVKEGLGWAKDKLLPGKGELHLLPESTDPVPDLSGDPYRSSGRPYQEEIPKETPQESAPIEQPPAQTESDKEIERYQEELRKAQERLQDWEKWLK